MKMLYKKFTAKAWYNNKRISTLRLRSMLFALLLSCFIQAQETNDSAIPAGVVKSNLLYDATATFNLGMEFRLGRRLTLDIPVNYNPWTYSSGRSIKHWLVQPELRYWAKESFNGHFLGLHLHGAGFNTSKIIDDYRYEGWLAGAGVSLGYRWNLSGRWGFEITAGAGYAYIDYTKYTAEGTSPDGCRTCGRQLASDIKHYWGPTKAGLSVSYAIGKSPSKKTDRSGDREIFFPVTVPENVPASKTDTLLIIRTDTVVRLKELHYHHETGSAQVLFAVDKHDLLPELGNNKKELSKIGRSLHIIRSKPGAKIEKITLEAYASPEGELSHNIELSGRRAEALCDYISEAYGIGRSFFTVRSKGENWEGLRAAVSASALLTSRERSDLLRILDIQDLATRKTLLKEYDGGKTYAVLVREIYPGLRTCEYRIDYTVPVKE